MLPPFLRSARPCLVQVASVQRLLFSPPEQPRNSVSQQWQKYKEKYKFTPQITGNVRTAEQKVKAVRFREEDMQKSGGREGRCCRRVEGKCQMDGDGLAGCISCLSPRERRARCFWRINGCWSLKSRRGDRHGVLPDRWCGGWVGIGLLGCVGLDGIGLTGWEMCKVSGCTVLRAVVFWS